MIPAALEIRSLVIHAAGRCLIDIEHLRAEAGSMVAFMGPNGAGKTTLLPACLGLAAATRGEVTVLGVDVRGLRGAALARLRSRIGYVPQLLTGRSELPLTVREVVAIGRTARAGLFHPLSRDDWQAGDLWIDRLGLARLAARAFSQSFGGEQRKTLIARAMAQEPELLLLDEPTANLDLGWRERIVETVETLCSQTGISVVLVCHEPEVLPPSCRQVVLLEAGRVAATGSPEAVFTTERVTRLYSATLRPVHQGGRHAVLPGGGRMIDLIFWAPVMAGGALAGASSGVLGTFIAGMRIPFLGVCVEWQLVKASICCAFAAEATVGVVAALVLDLPALVAVTHQLWIGFGAALDGAGLAPSRPVGHLICGEHAVEFLHYTRRHN